MNAILFSTLIAAMILPFSMMDVVEAEEQTKMSDKKKDRLIKKVQKLEERIAKTDNESFKERLQVKQQKILKKLHDDVSDVERQQSVKGQTTEFAHTANSATQDLFNLSGIHKGCDNANEIWNYEVDYASGGTWLSVDQWFPNMLTTGNSPYCEEHPWDDNVYIDIARIWDGQGCVSNLDVYPVDDYPLNCGTVLSGIYVVSVTADYDGEQTSSYTWFWI